MSASLSAFFSSGKLNFAVKFSLEQSVELMSIFELQALTKLHPPHEQRGLIPPTTHNLLVNMAVRKTRDAS